MRKIPDDRILARYLSGECSINEKEMVENWLHENPLNERLLIEIKKLWRERINQELGLDLEESWNKIEEKITYSQRETQFKSLQRQPSMTSRILGVAAVLLLVLILPYFYFNNIKKSEPVLQTVEMNELIVNYGTRANLTLTDGTKIILDAGSKITYPQSFEGEVREVFMSGEGVFDVPPNPEKPFIIHANNAVIKVFGTKFNIRAWDRSRKVEVAVAEGKVSLRSDTDTEEEAITILQGEYSVIPERGKPSNPLNVDIETYFSWQNREMTFNKSPLSEVLDQLERWYNLRFQLPDPSYATYVITIKIEPIPVNDILQAIALTMNLDFERNVNMVVFTPKAPIKKTVSLINALTK